MKVRSTQQDGRVADGARRVRAIERAASRWLARRELAGLSDADRSHFDAWLLADPAHHAAFERLSGALAAVDGAGPVVREADRRARVASTARSRYRTGMALGLTCVGLVSVLSTVDLPAEFADVRTGRAEVQAIALADGSRLLVDAGSAVDILYDAGHRTIALRRGRIHATVRHGDPRPFQVAAQGGTVRDAGTAFGVAIRDGAVETIVTDGIVLAINGGASLRLVRGQGARWSGAGQPRRIALPAGAEGALWRSGRLVFDRRPFGEIVATLDRYSGKPLWLWNRAVAARRVSGVVRSAAVDDSLASLAQAQGLRVRDLGFAILLY